MVQIHEFSPENYKEIKQVIETFTQFPHLKVLCCSDEFTSNNDEVNLEIAGAILARSQLEIFVTRVKHNETDLLKLLAKQTQLKKLSILDITDFEVLFTSLPKSVKDF